MTVHQLIDKLSKLPADTPVFLRIDDEGDLEAATVGFDPDYRPLRYEEDEPGFPAVIIEGEE
jgi:hypothetical protein